MAREVERLKGYLGVIPHLLDALGAMWAARWLSPRASCPRGCPGLSRSKTAERKGWTMTKREKPEVTEDAALEIALQDHPEWRRAWDQGKLPDEVVGEDGQPTSPRDHLHIHAVVERQLAADEPKGVVAVASELEQLGVSQHDVRHEIGAVIAKHMWYMTKEGCLFDEGRYLVELRKVVESRR